MNDQNEQNSNPPEGGEQTNPPLPPAQNSGNQPPPANPPNCQFVGKTEQLSKVTGKPEMVAKQASRRISDGETIIKLPSDEQQKAGFYTKHAQRLFTLHPDDYKKPVAKGEKQ